MKQTLRLMAVALVALMAAACQNTKSKTIDQWLADYDKLIVKVDAMDVDSMDAQEVLKSINSINAEYDAIYAPMVEQDIAEEDLTPEQGEVVNLLNEQWTQCIIKFNIRMEQIVGQMTGAEPSELETNE